MRVGTTELILILVVALVIFGPSKLPELGKLAGKAVGSFKHYVDSYEREWDVDADDEKTSSVKRDTVAQEQTTPEVANDHVEAV